MVKKLLLVALSSTFLVACADSASQKQRADTAEIDAVLTAYRDANLGFTKVESAGDDFLSRRQKQIAEAVGKIEPLMSKGTPSQQAAMRRIVSDAHASAARQIAREAMVKAAALGPQAAETLSFVQAVESSKLLGTSVAMKDNPRYQRLVAKQAEWETTKVERQRSLVELEASEKQRKKSIAELKEKQADAVVRAQTQRDKAFVAKGKEQLEVYAKAEAIQLQADRLGADIEMAEADLQIVTGQIKIVKTEINVLTEDIELMKSEAKKAQSRQQEATELVAGAEKSHLEAGEELAKRFEALAKAYSESVDAPMARAHQRMQESAKLLEAATSLASGSDRNAMKLDLLRRHSERAYFYSQHIFAAGSYLRALEVVESAASRLPPDRSSYYRENREAARRQVEQLGRQAQQVIAEGVKLAADLNPNGGDTSDTGTAITQSGERLRKYAATVATATGVKAQDPEAVPVPAPDAVPASEPAAS